MSVRRHRWPGAWLLAGAVAACTAATPPASARLERLDAGRFRFTAPADPQRPLTDPQAEHTRLRWLASRLAEQRLCPQGYRIVRRDVRDDSGLVKASGEGSFEVVYEGDCRD